LVTYKNRRRQAFAEFLSLADPLAATLCTVIPFGVTQERPLLIFGESGAKKLSKRRRTAPLADIAMLQQTAQQYGKLMATEEPLVFKVDERSFWRTTQIFLRVAVLHLIIVPVLRKRHADRSGLSTPAGSSRTLLVVLNARRHVPAEGCLQLPDIYTQFHSGGAAQHTDLSLSEIALQLLSHSIVNSRGMFLNHHADIALACVNPHVVVLGRLAAAFLFGDRLEIALAAKRGAFGRYASELTRAAGVAAVECAFASIQNSQPPHIEYKRPVVLNNEPVSLESLERCAQDGIVVRDSKLAFQKPTATVCEHSPLIINGR
jgi:hypothetical protein